MGRVGVPARLAIALLRLSPLDTTQVGYGCGRGGVSLRYHVRRTVYAVFERRGLGYLEALSWRNGGDVTEGGRSRRVRTVSRDYGRGWWTSAFMRWGLAGSWEGWRGWLRVLTCVYREAVAGLLLLVGEHSNARLVGRTSAECAEPYLCKVALCSYHSSHCLHICAKVQ